MVVWIIAVAGQVSSLKLNVASSPPDHHPDHHPQPKTITTASQR